MKERSKAQKIGVAWKKLFKNGLEGLKISINQEIYIAYPNKRKQKITDPDFVIVKFISKVD